MTQIQTIFEVLDDDDNVQREHPVALTLRSLDEEAFQKAREEILKIREVLMK